MNRSFEYKISSRRLNECQFADVKIYIEVRFLPNSCVHLFYILLSCKLRKVRSWYHDTSKFLHTCDLALSLSWSTVKIISYLLGSRYGQIVSIGNRHILRSSVLTDSGRDGIRVGYAGGTLLQGRAYHGNLWRHIGDPETCDRCESHQRVRPQLRSHDSLT